MPIYEFICEKCKTIFETLVLSSQQKKDVTCPQCKTDQVKKMPSGFSCNCGSDGLKAGFSSSCGSSPTRRFG
ncbi:MAG: zinc ribbon domain-containing protein [Deltaproteobacteria bacterium]|nr:zinc ribbon domain-containing protein [Deltaproteobacteria bacterium]